MIEPVASQNLFAFFMVAAGVVFLGFSYVLLYALGRAHPRWRYGAVLAYALLVLAVLALARLGNWNGLWQVLAGLLLLGYGLVPIWILRLTAIAHRDERRRQ